MQNVLTSCILEFQYVFTPEKFDSGNCSEKLEYIIIILKGV